MTIWIPYGSYTDIKYHKTVGIAKITINRPEVRNAFRPHTVEEMRHALNDARNDSTIGVIVLTGEGKEAFCSGGDQKIRKEAGYADEQGVHRLNVLDFQRQMRACPKPIIAMIAGFAVGGGHVLHVLCECFLRFYYPFPSLQGSLLMVSYYHVMIHVFYNKQVY